MRESHVTSPVDERCIIFSLLYCSRTFPAELVDSLAVDVVQHNAVLLRVGHSRHLVRAVPAYVGGRPEVAAEVPDVPAVKVKQSDCRLATDLEDRQTQTGIKCETIQSTRLQFCPTLLNMHLTQMVVAVL